MTKSTVLVIIISYKTSELMPKLVQSLQEDAVAVSILILDNAATDESFSELKNLTDNRVQIIKSEKNLGFAGGVNFAFQYALKNLPPVNYVFLFNPDALSQPNLIGALVEALQSDKNAVAASPQILYLNGKPWYAGATIDRAKGKVFNNAILAPEEEKPYHEIDVFSGCAALFDMEKIQETGGLNEDLFMYYDEADFSMRLKSKGYKILYVPSLVMYHDVSYTTRNISHLKTYYMTRNRFMVFGNTMSLSSKLYFLLHEAAFHLKNRRLQNVYYHLKGYIDYKRGIKGQLKEHA